MTDNQYTIYIGGSGHEFGTLHPPSTSSAIGNPSGGPGANGKSLAEIEAAIDAFLAEGRAEESPGIKVGEIIAYRSWHVFEWEQPTLVSLHHPDAWRPGQIKRAGPPLSTAPRPHGTSGLYAYREWWRARWYLSTWIEGRHRAYGTVALSGIVCEHDLGYRAEFARIVSIDKVKGFGRFGGNRRMRARLRKIYGLEK